MSLRRHLTQIFAAQALRRQLALREELAQFHGPRLAGHLRREVAVGADVHLGGVGRHGDAGLEQFPALGHEAPFGVDAEVAGREKRPFSIWRKMQERHIPFEQLSDVIAFRVIVGQPDDCYRALGIIHQRWPMVPGRFKDFISTPKRNGYRSLHTTIIRGDHMRVEIQIRTRTMHDQAEMGLAAHWAYKQDEDAVASQQYPWLTDLLEILEQAESPEEMMEHAKLGLYQDQVFCFTPKGELIQLPRGSTPVDFAYAVHTKLGEMTVGAKVNGRVVPLRTQLANGDQVEILRSSKQRGG